MFTRTSVVGTYLGLLKHDVNIGMVKIYKQGDVYVKESHLNAMYYNMDRYGEPFTLVYTELYEPSWLEKLKIRMRGRVLRFPHISPAPIIKLRLENG